MYHLSAKTTQMFLQNIFRFSVIFTFLGTLVKSFWGECSEVAVGLVIATVGCGLVYRSWLKDQETGYGHNKPYRTIYTVYRPDDPRIAKLRSEWYENGAPPMTSSKI